MKQVTLTKINGDARAFIAGVNELYVALRTAAKRENDLRTYVAADLSIASLRHAVFMLDQPYAYVEPAYYLRADATDDIDDMLRMRMAFVTNSARA